VAGGKLQAPRGTFDVLPDDARRRDRLVELGAQLLEGAGYAHAETPIFEDTALFARGVGGSTDIVQKEMFTFEDMGGRSLTLRPENTAGICRAYIEHGMHKLPQPVKLWSAGPFFRHEAPQAGRYRQFTQLNVEALGSDDPSLDAELIVLLAQILERCGVKARLLLSSLGNSATRAEYGEDLLAHLRAHESELSDEVRARIDNNPLRAFDSDHPGTRAVMAEAPRLIDRLDPEDAAHFAEVRALLEEAGCAYELDSTLVRGLDYYTRTVFEFESADLGAQSGVGGGGRYDGLVEQLGGPHTPGVGWAAGVERIMLASRATMDDPAGTRAYVVVAKPDRRRQAFGLVRSLRAAGVIAEMEQAGRSFKGQMKQADRVGATHAVIVGDSIEVKEMATGEQREVGSVEDAVGAVAG
jgi:histidyl-tRNA synthetase